MKTVLGLLCLVALSVNADITENDLLNSVHQDCMQHNTISCLKLRVFSFADKVMGGFQETTPIFQGVDVVKVAGSQEAPRSLGADSTIESLFVDKVSRFLSSHTVKINLSGKDVASAVTETARGLTEAYRAYNEPEEDEYDEVEVEGRKKKIPKRKLKKVKKIFAPLMAIFALKLVTLAKLFLVAVALIAAKAAIIGKIALALSVVLAVLRFLGRGAELAGSLAGHSLPIAEDHGFEHHNVVHHGFDHHDHHGINHIQYAADGGYAGRSLSGADLAYRGHQ